MRCICLYPACTSAAPESMSTTCAVPRSPSSRSSVNATRRCSGDSRTWHAEGVPQGFMKSHAQTDPYMPLQPSKLALQIEHCCDERTCADIEDSV